MLNSKLNLKKIQAYVCISYSNKIYIYVNLFELLTSPLSKTKGRTMFWLLYATFPSEVIITLSLPILTS